MNEVKFLIGSLQITIPAGCMNNCSFCIYRQHLSKFARLWNVNKEQWNIEIERRLRYATNRVASVMITSHGEPTLNMDYIHAIVEIINRVTPTLSHIELQTSGVGLTETKLDILYELGVRIISLSVPALDRAQIIDIMQVPEQCNYNPHDLVRLVKSKGFILRLSIAMTSWFDDFSLDAILSLLKEVWKPDQVSFKKLYGADEIASKKYDEFVTEFKENPEVSRLELLSTGLWKYDAYGIAIVWNDDCMVRRDTEKPRYLILQPDGRLYTRWDSKASVIF
jgi:molybdenum cofactor biosynthesis enzyme MoaA